MYLSIFIFVLTDTAAESIALTAVFSLVIHIFQCQRTGCKLVFIGRCIAVYYTTFKAGVFIDCDIKPAFSGVNTTLVGYTTVFGISVCSIFTKSNTAALWFFIYTDINTKVFIFSCIVISILLAFNIQIPAYLCCYFITAHLTAFDIHIFSARDSEVFIGCNISICMRRSVTIYSTAAFAIVNTAANNTTNTKVYRRPKAFVTGVKLIVSTVF